MKTSLKSLVGKLDPLCRRAMEVAVGEAVAHLDHLAVLGRLRRMEDVAGSVTYAEMQTSDRVTSRA